jgi:hypothetical protein
MAASLAATAVAPWQMAAWRQQQPESISVTALMAAKRLKSNNVNVGVSLAK